jgi:hypothetical protein
MWQRTEPCSSVRPNAFRLPMFPPASKYSLIVAGLPRVARIVSCAP